MNFRSGVLRQPGSTTWRKRAGVAKGTIYLHFADKEELFQELVRTMLGPLVANLQELSTTDFPIRTVLERFVDVFVNGLFKTRRREVAYSHYLRGRTLPETRRILLPPGHWTWHGGDARVAGAGESNGGKSRIKPLLSFLSSWSAPGVHGHHMGGLCSSSFAHLDAAAMMQSHIEILLGASGVCHDGDHHLPSAVAAPPAVQGKGAERKIRCS